MDKSICSNCRLRVGDYCFCGDDPEKINDIITECDYFFDGNDSTYYEFIDGYSHCNKLKNIALHKNIRKLEMENKELRCDPFRFLDAMLGAASYQMDDDRLADLYDELIKRFKKYDVDFSAYGNLIYGALVMLFGDYGTSPRTGWFYSPETAAKCAEYITDLKRQKEEQS